jgi:hypothetical protein
MAPRNLETLSEPYQKRSSTMHPTSRTLNPCRENPSSPAVDCNPYPGKTARVLCKYEYSAVRRSPPSTARKHATIVPRQVINTEVPVIRNQYDPHQHCILQPPFMAPQMQHQHTRFLRATRSAPACCLNNPAVKVCVYGGVQPRAPETLRSVLASEVLGAAEQHRCGRRSPEAVSQRTLRRMVTIFVSPIPDSKLKFSRCSKAA